MNPRKGYQTEVSVVRKRPAEKGFVPKSGSQTVTTVVGKRATRSGQVESIVVRRDR